MFNFELYSCESFKFKKLKIIDEKAKALIECRNKSMNIEKKIINK